MCDTNNSKLSKFVSFNCKNVKKCIDCVRDLCAVSDVVALQETWLLPYDISLLGTIDVDFNYTGKSAVDLSSSFGWATFWGSGNIVA